MIYSFESFTEYLAGGRNKASRPIENNTRVERLDADTIGVRLHDTDVVKFHRDGSVTLDSGGWLTVTTKDRMNRYLPTRDLRIASDRGKWFIYHVPGWTKLSPYFDGITVAANGTILNPRDPKLEERIAQAEDKMAKAISRYLDGYFAAMERGEVPKPSGGDCWDCSFIVSEGPDRGKPLGDVKDGDHLMMHIKERYYVPSLLWNAVRSRGYGSFEVVMSMRLDRDAFDNEGLMKVARDWRSDQPSVHAAKELRHDLRKYLVKRLLKSRAH